MGEVSEFGDRENSVIIFGNGNAVQRSGAPVRIIKMRTLETAELGSSWASSGLA